METASAASHLDGLLCGNFGPVEIHGFSSNYPHYHRSQRKRESQGGESEKAEGRSVGVFSQICELCDSVVN